MRRLFAFSCLAFCLITLSGPPLVAQFQQSTPEELRMAEDPKYPGASAIILNHEEKYDDVVHYTSIYSRIKILKETAKDLATVQVGYFRGGMEVAQVSGRTIHADGAIVPLAVKPADLMQAKQGDMEVRRVVFNMPSVEVGSIIEYYYQVRYGEKRGGYDGSSSGGCSQPQWEIQGEYPVRKAHYIFTPCAGVLDGPGLSSMGIVDNHGQMLTDLVWYPKLPAGKTITPTAAHRFELTVEDVPPLPNEAWMPPTESQRYQVRFYYSPGRGQAYWTNESQYWLKDVLRFTEASSSFKAMVAEMAPPSLPPLDRARKLYGAVQGLENTDYTRAKGKAELKAEGLRQPKRAEDTWNQKSGSSEDLALLYLAMLRLGGISAYPMKVVDRERGMFNTNYLNFDQLDDTVVVANIDGKDMVLDPGQKMCPFGLASWLHSGAGGIRQTDKGIDPWITPLTPYSENVITRRADLTVSADGSVTGKLLFGMTGQDALRWRQMSLVMDEEAVKQRFDGWIRTQVPDSVQAHLDHFTNLQDPAAELGAVAMVSGSAGSVTGKRILLPASFFNMAENRRFVKETTRMWPVDMHYAAQVKDGVLYHLPAGYTVEGAAPQGNVPWPQHAVYVQKATVGASTLSVMNTLTRAFTFLQPDEYSALRDFYQKVGEAAQQQVVLTAGATVAAN